MNSKRKIFCWVFIFSTVILLAGCIPEDLPAGKLTDYKLYSANCSSCHRLLPPENYTLKKLEEYIEKYRKEMLPEEKARLLNALKEYKSMKEGK